MHLENISANVMRIPFLIKLQGSEAEAEKCEASPHRDFPIFRACCSTLAGAFQFSEDPKAPTSNVGGQFRRYLKVQEFIVILLFPGHKIG